MSNFNINTWLANRQRKYADGLSLFRELAPEEMKAKFLSFFSEVENVPQFDNHFTVLINKLTTIARLAGSQQIKASEKTGFIVTNSNIMNINASANDAKGDHVLKEILVKESELLDLRDQIKALSQDNDDKSEEIENLESELESKEDELQELQEQFSALRPGAKIVTYSSLPDDIRQIFDRVREITPLYASYFTEMQNESLTPEEREPIANKVYGLWIERAELWNKIDDWAEGKQVTLKVDEPKTEDLPSDSIIKGLQMGNRIERLKENIRRTEHSIVNHEQNGKLNLKEKAECRLADYKKELDELEKMK